MPLCGHSLESGSNNEDQQKVLLSDTSAKNHGVVMSGICILYLIYFRIYFAPTSRNYLFQITLCSLQDWNLLSFLDYLVQFIGLEPREQNSFAVEIATYRKAQYNSNWNRFPYVLGALDFGTPTLLWCHDPFVWYQSRWLIFGPLASQLSSKMTSDVRSDIGRPPL